MRNNIILPSVQAPMLLARANHASAGMACRPSGGYRPSGRPVPVLCEMESWELSQRVKGLGVQASGPAIPAMACCHFGCKITCGMGGRTKNGFTRLTWASKYSHSTLFSTPIFYHEPLSRASTTAWISRGPGFVNQGIVRLAEADETSEEITGRC